MFGGIGTVLSAVALGYGPGKRAGGWPVSASTYLLLGISIIAIRGAGSLAVVQSILFACFSAARASYLATTVSSLMTAVHQSQRGAMNGLLSVTFQIAVATGSAGAVLAYRSDQTYSANAAAALALLVISLAIQYYASGRRSVLTSPDRIS